MLIIDGFCAVSSRVLVIGIGIVTIFSVRRLSGSSEKANGGEYYALILYSIVGQCVMATANELIMVFIGLEISSIASYVLAGYLRDDALQQQRIGAPSISCSDPSPRRSCFMESPGSTEPRVRQTSSRSGPCFPPGWRPA